MADNSIAAMGRYQKARRLVLAVLVVLLFSIFLFGQSIFPPETFVHESVEMTGIVLIVLGIAGRLWATLYIGGRKSAEIVADGPYSISRNPLYLFSALGAAGIGAQMGSIVAAIGFAALCTAAFHIVILREERFLEAVFGEPYRAYLAHVPRFFPNVALYREGEPRGFQPRRLMTALFDGLLFFVAMPVFELIDSAQMSGVLPVLFRLP